MASLVTHGASLLLLRVAEEGETPLPDHSGKPAHRELIIRLSLALGGAFKVSRTRRERKHGTFNTPDDLSNLETLTPVRSRPLEEKRERWAPSPTADEKKRVLGKQRSDVTDFQP